MSKTLCIIGVGLIGGSLARAVRNTGNYAEIIGCGRNADNLKKAVELGVIDRYEQDPVLAVKEADIIVVAVPLGAMAEVLEQIAGHVSDTAVITDVGSAKESVVNDARQTLGKAINRFVPGHPIAGTEESGVEASFAELFQGRRVILTPTNDTLSEATECIRQLWMQAGAKVQNMRADHHDEVLAATSHLPHVLAYVLVDTLARMSERDEIFEYAAGGFRDFTRIASSDPSLWRDICQANRHALLDMLERYQKDLQEVSTALQNEEYESLLKVFTQAKQARDRYSNNT